VEFTREDCVWTAYSVDKTENSMDAERELVARYRVPEGEVELQDLTE
jgi:alkaline phosphatase D